MKLKVHMEKEDVIRCEQLYGISKDLSVKAEHMTKAATLAEAIYNCAIAAKVVADFNMWRGDPHFDEKDVSDWLYNNRLDADILIRSYRGPRTCVKFLYHNKEVFSCTVRGKDRQDCIEQGMNEFNLLATQDYFDTIVIYPTSTSN